MASTINMPKLSPTMEEGTIVKWHKKEGDQVNSGDLLFEVATDKATVEHNALDDGYIRKILVQEGSIAKINQPVAIFSETADESIDDVKIEEPKEEKKEEAEEKPKGDKAEEKPSAQPQATLQEPIFVPEPPLEEFDFTRFTKQKVSASPLAKKIAKEKGLDLSSVKGSGPKGRVMSRDLDFASGASMISFAEKAPPKTMPGTFEEQSLSQMRKVIGKRLQQSKSFIPHFYLHQTIDVSSLVKLREELKTFNLKFSYNDFVVKAVALSLRNHPVVNSGYNSQTQSIVYFKTIDISIAVSLEEGLITPILRLADYKNLQEISFEVKSLVKKAKEGKLSPEEFKGGSFTISNLGMYGTSDFLAVINPPQSAILAVSAIEEKPVVREGKVVPGHLMNVTLSCDHRVIDGAVGASFLKDLKMVLESPSVLLT
jgi:pyruvate dehydrogenase E2 component (dihydrolipoamide acetyltransferase)